MTKYSLETRMFDRALMKKIHHCTVIIIKILKKFCRMEIGISRVYNVMIVLKLRQSVNRQPILCSCYI